MRIDLHDDPAVVMIANALDSSEDEVVGKLHRLWGWADRHTTDGIAPAITIKWIDRYVGRVGFADAMVLARWLQITEAGVRFPGFDRHNGDSAKSRADTALRVRKHRERNAGVTNGGNKRTAIPRPFVRAVLTRDAYTCVYCGDTSTPEVEESSKARLSIDHIAPHSRGGRQAVVDLATACLDCNMEKSDRTPEEWGLLPTFLQSGVTYKDQTLTDPRYSGVTKALPEKSRKEETTPIAPGARFTEFWESYPGPRKNAKTKCAEHWEKNHLESVADQILGHVEAMKKSDQWRRDGGQFVPAPLTYLNQRRWEDGAPSGPERRLVI